MELLRRTIPTSSSLHFTTFSAGILERRWDEQKTLRPGQTLKLPETVMVNGPAAKSQKSTWDLSAAHIGDGYIREVRPDCLMLLIPNDLTCEQLPLGDEESLRPRESGREVLVVLLRFEDEMAQRWDVAWPRKKRWYRPRGGDNARAKSRTHPLV